MFQRNDRVGGLALLREWQVEEDLEAQKKATRGKLTPSERRAINKDLNRRGLDGNARFRSMGQVAGEVAGVLRTHGVEVDEVITADRFRHSTGSTAFRVAHSNPDEPMAPQQITNSMVALQWTELKSGYEVIAYMS